MTPSQTPGRLSAQPSSMSATSPWPAAGAGSTWWAPVPASTTPWLCSATTRSQVWRGTGGMAGAGGGPRGPGVGHRWPQGPSARPRLSGWMGGGTPGIGVANVVRERAATGLLQRAMAPPQRWMGWWRKAGAHRGHQHRAIAPHSLEVWGLEAQCQVEGWGDQEALPQVLNLSGCWIGLEPALWEGAVGLDPRGLVGTSSGSRVGVGVWAPI